MGREVRRVPVGWKHPTVWNRYRGEEYQPMHDSTYAEAWADHQKSRAEHPEWYANASGDYAPDPLYHRPEWPEGVTLGYQLYENVSEGTPLSPVFETADQLAEWLAEGQPIGIGRDIVHMTFEQARVFVDRGYAPSMVYSPDRGLVSGMELA